MAKRLVKRNLSVAGRKRRMRRDPASRLLDEIGRYVKAKGGEALVGGPIRMVDWPEDALRNSSSPPHMQFFAVDVKVMGRRPDISANREASKSFGAGEKGADAKPLSDKTNSPAPEQ